MKAIEIMAKAYIEAEPCAADWDEMPTKRKEPIFSGMRAALLALADAELPSEAMVDGGEAIDSNFGMTDTSRAELAFRAMLRSICHADTAQQNEGEE